MSTINKLWKKIRDTDRDMDSESNIEKCSVRDLNRHRNKDS